ncbi:MAG: type II toxin-antitoxin system HicB family antitoxin [Gammaproteobacteria bacterium]|nr:type II toxin-antitoxin system HicB family antitoxin [Gammaproteobacteria bacterium]
MKTVHIVIERTKNGFTAYAKNVEAVYAAGDSVTEVKQSVDEAISLLVSENKPQFIPSILKGRYQIEYAFDLESFLAFYKGIFTNSALERLTGINQRLIQQYAVGLKKPREKQRKRIEHALHLLGEELLAVRL